MYWFNPRAWKILCLKPYKQPYNVPLAGWPVGKGPK